MDKAEPLKLLIYIDDKSKEFDVLELINHFIDIEFGELKFTPKEGPDSFVSSAYPRDRLSAEIYLETIDTSKPIVIDKEGSFLRYLPKEYRPIAPCGCGYQVFQVRIDPKHTTFLDKITSLLKLPGFQSDFKVCFNEGEGYHGFNGKEFLEKLNDLMYQSIVIE